MRPSATGTVLYIQIKAVLFLCILTDGTVCTYYSKICWTCFVALTPKDNVIITVEPEGEYVHSS